MRETVYGVKRVGPRRSKRVPALVCRTVGLLTRRSLIGRSCREAPGLRLLLVGGLVGLRDRLGVLL